MQLSINLYIDSVDYTARASRSPMNCTIKYMDSKTNFLFSRFKEICDKTNAHPVVLFAKGNFGGTETWIMLAGPVLTLETLAQLRRDVLECIDEREKLLRSGHEPGTPSVSIRKE